ncbi:MAG: c-type cytochrome [Acidobacteria bacterium]|nr:c-type cytochrome [Acidobacteriota bacterium]
MFKVLLLCAAAFAQPKGRPASPAEIAPRDITVFADGRGLPPGKGRASEGAAIYKSKCAECHNDRGEGREGQYPPIAGGIGSLTSTKPRKTVGSYWPYATTVFDYIRRAMPFDHPRTLSTNEVYAVTAFVLHLNGITALDEELSEKTLPKVAMPNRDGFVPDKRPDIRSKR